MIIRFTKLLEIVFINNCLGMFFSNNNFAFLFLNYSLNTVSRDECSFLLWFCIFNGRNVKIAFGNESNWDLEKEMSL